MGFDAPHTHFSRRWIPAPRSPPSPGPLAKQGNARGADEKNYRFRVELGLCACILGPQAAGELEHSNTPNSFECSVLSVKWNALVWCARLRLMNIVRHRRTQRGIAETEGKQWRAQRALMKFFRANFRPALAASKSVAVISININ